MIQNLVDREPRYRVHEGDEELRVIIESENDETKSISATLVDLSCGGAKLRIPDEIAADARLTLRIEAPQLQGVLEVAADVCWTRVAVGTEWWLGCAFEPQIPIGTLQQLAEHGTIDRRATQRLATEIDIAASYDVGTERIPVRLTDLSAGGFCLQSPQPVAPNSRVLLRIDVEADGDIQEKLIVAKSRWQVEAEEGYVIGCEFLDAESHFAIRKLHYSATVAETPLWKRLLRIGD